MSEPKGPLVRQRLLMAYEEQMRAAYTLSKGAYPDQEFAAFVMDIEEEPGYSFAVYQHGKVEADARIKNWQGSERFPVDIGAAPIEALRKLLLVKDKQGREMSPRAAATLALPAPPGAFWGVVIANHATMVAAIAKQ
jgi:hypothetical protein